MRLTVEDTFKQYGDRIFSAAFSVCQNRADADDVVQDTLIRYYSSGKDFESEEHLKAWLLRAATPQALTAISPPRISTQGTDFKKGRLSPSLFYSGCVSSMPSSLLAIFCTASSPWGSAPLCTIETWSSLGSLSKASHLSIFTIITSCPYYAPKLLALLLIDIFFRR